MNRPTPILVILMLLAAALQAQEPEQTTMMLSEYPFATSTVSLPSGVDIAYSDEGTGKVTLLMIHGLGSYSPAWQKMIVHLEEDFRCISMDLPGYGRSGIGQRPYSMAYFASVVAELIAELELEHVVLVGHSMGAQIAMTCVLETEAPVEKLVLLAPAGFERFTEEEAAAMMAVVTPESLFATSAEDLKPRFSVNFNGNMLPEDAAFMYEDRVALKQDSAAYRTYCEGYAGCVQAMLDGPVADRMGELEVPVLTFFGEQDLLIPNRYFHPTLTTEEVAKAGAGAISRGEYYMLPDCGHFVLWDQARLVSEAVSDWLQP